MMTMFVLMSLPVADCSTFLLLQLRILDSQRCTVVSEVRQVSGTSSSRSVTDRLQEMSWVS